MKKYIFFFIFNFLAIFRSDGGVNKQNLLNHDFAENPKIYIFLHTPEWQK